MIARVEQGGTIGRGFFAAMCWNCHVLLVSAQAVAGWLLGCGIGYRIEGLDGN
jgi:hypothetical protein